MSDKKYYVKSIVSSIKRTKEPNHHPSRLSAATILPFPYGGNMKAASAFTAILAGTVLSLVAFQTISTRPVVAQSAKSRTIKLTGARAGTAVFQDAGANKTRVTLKLDNPSASDTYS